MSTERKRATISATGTTVRSTVFEPRVGGDGGWPLYLCRYVDLFGVAPNH